MSGVRRKRERGREGEVLWRGKLSDGKEKVMEAVFSRGEVLPSFGFLVLFSRGFLVEGVVLIMIGVV